MATNLREQVITQLDRLDETQLAHLLRYLEIMQADELPDDYDPDRDPAIGFITQAVDFEARQVKEILRRDITGHSGWTQKDD